MYITVPMRNQRHRKLQRKHQQSIFKEIQYNNLFQKITQQDQLKKSNGFVSVKEKIIQDKQNNYFRNSFTTIRRGSLLSDKLKKQRPSITSIVSSKQKKNQFSKTMGEFYAKTNTFQNNETIEQKPQERQSQQVSTEKQKPNFHMRKSQELNQNQQDLIYQAFSQPKRKKKSAHKRSNITLLDLKVQSIEQILRKSGKSNVEDFKIFSQKQEKKNAQNCWKNFYKQCSKNLCQKNKNFIQQKISKLKRTGTVRKRGTIMQNQIEDIFLQKKKVDKQAKIKNYRSENVSPTKQCQKKQLPHQHKKVSSMLLQSQKISRFYTFVKGDQKCDQFSSKISLNDYRKNKNKYYILKNIQNQIKQSTQYKKITIQNFHLLNPGQVLAFVYLNQNNYKLCSKKQQNLCHFKEIVP